MPLRAHIRRIVAWIDRRRRQAEIRRAIPKLRELDERIAVERRTHRPVAHLMKAKQEIIHSALAKGLR